MMEGGIINYKSFNIVDTIQPLVYSNIKGYIVSKFVMAKG